ncbi:MAG: PorT family protein [Prevotella sp.]|nr:PorT family protein [Prevotella sp.]
MKKIMMIAAMIVASMSANAQVADGVFTLKPTVGINLANMTKLDDSKMRAGLVAGVEGEYGLADDFSFSAGVLYSQQGAKYKDSFYGANLDLTCKLDYINIPIMANYYIVKGLAVKVGVQPGFKVSSKISGNATYDDLNSSGSSSIDNAKGFALSVPMGLSYEYNNIVLDARYNLGVTKALDNGDAKHSWFAITLGYKFAL